MQRTEANSYLDELVDECFSQSDVTIEKAVQGGRAAERILEQARERGHDLIVISSHGQSGLSGWNVNSVAHKVINRAGVSILLVRAYKLPDSPVAPPVCAATYRRILVPLDGSRRSEHVLPAAVRLAKQHGAELLLVHGIVTPELFQQTPLGVEDGQLINRVVEHNKRQAEHYFKDLARRLDVPVKSYVLTGEDVAETLHRFVEEKEVDLVAIGAHGRSGKHAWPYGSVTSSFITYGTTHLLIVQDLPWQKIDESSAAEASRQQRHASPTNGNHAISPERGLPNIAAFALPRNSPRSFWS